MLEKIFKKDEKETNLNIIIIIGIIIAVIFLSATSGMDSMNGTVDTEDVNVKELLSNITDNYTAKINISNSLESKNFNYSRDSKVEILDEGDYSNKAYLVYNNKKYLIDVENYKLSKINKIDILEDPYINFDLIKRITNICEFEDVNTTNKLCTIKASTYLNEYNSIYKTNFSSEEDMNINISYYPTRIYSITIDYTNVDKVINNGEDILKYEFVFSDIGKNNYEEMLKYYKKELK